MTRPVRNASEELRLLPGGPEPVDPERVKEHVGTLLDSLAMLAIGGGVAWGLWPYLAAFAIAVGGVALAAMNAAASLLREPAPEPEQLEPPTLLPTPLPGPEDEGTLHVSGR